MKALLPLATKRPSQKPPSKPPTVVSERVTSTDYLPSASMVRTQSIVALDRVSSKIGMISSYLNAMLETLLKLGIFPTLSLIYWLNDLASLYSMMMRVSHHLLVR